jgi:hypothetical protein
MKGDLMKNRFFFGAVSLVAVLLVIACAPAATATQEIIVLPTTATLAPAVDSAPATEAAQPVVIEATATTQSESVQAVPTSRGEMLEATDPSTVSLASGQLQLVEFFRFT